MISKQELKERFERGENLAHFLRNELQIDYNSPEIIELIYDFQTGSYNQRMFADEHADWVIEKKAFCKSVADKLNSLCEFESVMEAGVGEGTTLSGVLSHMKSDIKGFGFDLSYSRVAETKRWLTYNKIKNTELCTGNLFDIPFLDNSIDVVYTSHTIEPNRGSEQSIILELYRITRKYLVLLEPAYEFADAKVQARMDQHSYCRGIYQTCSDLGFEIIEYGLFDGVVADRNPTAITIIKKVEEDRSHEGYFACPECKRGLVKYDDCYYSRDSMKIYPVINGIPCLVKANGIFSSQFEKTTTQNK